MPPDPRVHVGVAGVVEKDDCLLMLQRGGQGQFASDGYGKWSVPGGWLDFGENPFEAAVREVVEESGVKAVSGPEIGFVNCASQDGGFQIVTLFILCRYVSGEPTITEPDKCPEVAWTPWVDVLLLFDQDMLFAPCMQWLEKYGRPDHARA